MNTTPASSAIPTGLARQVRATRSSRIGSVGFSALVVLAFSVALAGSKAWQGKLVDVAVFVSLASLWNLLAGYAGLLSIGQQAFFGLGCYGMIVYGNGAGLYPFLSVGPAAVTAAVLAIPIGLVAFRLRGPYFAIGMWVSAEVVRLIVKNNTSKTIGGGRGTSLAIPESLRADRLRWTAVSAIFVALVVIGGCALLIRSRFGLALQASRDNETGARALGADPWRVRFIVFVLTAAATAGVGAVFQMKALNVQPDSAFSVASWTAPIVVMVVIGGLGTIEGPILGATFYYFIGDFVSTPRHWYSLSPVVFQIATGVLALICALYIRGGIWGTLSTRFPHLQLVALQRRLVMVEGSHD